MSTEPATKRVVRDTGFAAEFGGAGGFGTEPRVVAEGVGRSRFSVIRENHHHVRLLALHLEQLARDEIARIDREAPQNDPETVVRNQTQRDLLSTLADGFAQIAAALALLEDDPDQPVLLGRAADIAHAVGEKIRLWWEHNGEATINLGAKVSMLGAGTAMLGLLGVDLNLSAKIVGGVVVAKDAIAGLKRKPKK